MRGLKDLKSTTCTQSMGVNAAGISVKVAISYPECSLTLSGFLRDYNPNT